MHPTVIVQDTFGGWWMVSGVLRHKVTTTEKNTWLFLDPAIPVYTGSFGQLIIETTAQV